MTHRILVFGGGSIGTRHAKNLLKCKAGEVMIVEPDEKRSQVLAKELNVQSQADGERAIASFKPDIVFVCSPTALHVPHAAMAMAAGAHIFIEKPLSHTMQGVEELRRKALQQKRTVMVGCNMRFHPGVKEVKRLLDAGAIGAPLTTRIVYRGYLPTWRPQQDYRKSYSASLEQGGAVLDCIHEIDLALWELGPGEVTEANVESAASIGLETDGLAELTLRHASGAESSIHVSFIEKQFERSQCVTGTEGSLSWDFERGSVERFRKDGTQAETIRQPEGWEPNQMFLEELDHFLNAVETGATPMGSLDEATAALKIALTVRGR